MNTGGRDDSAVHAMASASASAFTFPASHVVAAIPQRLHWLPAGKVSHLHALGDCCHGHLDRYLLSSMPCLPLSPSPSLMR